VSQPIEVNPKAMRDGADKLDELATKVRKAEKSLPSAGDGPKFWGDDHIGEGFAKNYEPGCKEIEDGLKAALKSIQEMADTVRQQAADWKKTDQQNIDAAGKVGTDRQTIDPPRSSGSGGK
jgi:uncharacterized protein YukE